MGEPKVSDKEVNYDFTDENIQDIIKENIRNNSELNTEERHSNQQEGMNDQNIGFPNNNFSFAEPVRQRSNFALFGNLNNVNTGLNMNSSYPINPMMKFSKVNNMQGMMNLDFPPTMEPPHRFNDMRLQPNMPKQEPIFNMDAQ